MADAEQATKELGFLLARYGDARRRSSSAWLKGLDEEREELVALMAAALERWAPDNSTYVRRFRHLMASDAAHHSDVVIQRLPGWISALKLEYENGTTAEWSERFRNSVFSDFLGLADEILPHSPDAAALVAGSVLEEHLRKLALKNNLDIKRDEKNYKKVETLAQDLVKADVIRATDHRHVTAWYAIRNDPAHAKFNLHAEREVALMVQGISDFIGRFPA